MNLPLQYQWLLREPGPKMLLQALGLYGTLEKAGTGDNPTILAWAKEVGLEKTYSHDSIPWCGLFMAVVATRAGKEVVDTPLWALAWADFGEPVPVGPEGKPTPMLGDVLTYKREGGGHVNLYIGEDSDAYHGIGGNQSDMVNITRIHKSRLYRARRPIYSVGQPPNVRRVRLVASGTLSQNEA